jgi:hypothetical protein
MNVEFDVHDSRVIVKVQKQVCISRYRTQYWSYTKEWCGIYDIYHINRTILLCKPFVCSQPAKPKTVVYSLLVLHKREK